MSASPVKEDSRKKRKKKRTASAGSGSGSSGSTGSNSAKNEKGPSDDELKLLRARFQNKFNAFASAFHSNSNDQKDIPNVVRVPLRRRASKSPTIVVSPPVDDGMAPTVFEMVSGGHCPAKTKMRKYDIFKGRRLRKKEVQEPSNGVQESSAESRKQSKKLKKKLKKTKPKEEFKSHEKPKTPLPPVETTDIKQKQLVEANIGKTSEKPLEKVSHESDKDMNVATAKQGLLPEPVAKPEEQPHTAILKPEEQPSATILKSEGQPQVTISKSEEQAPATIPKSEGQPQATISKLEQQLAPTQQPSSDGLYSDLEIVNSLPPPPTQPSSESVVVSSSSVAKAGAPTETSGVLGQYKDKKSLFDSMDNEIVLDDKVLKDIAYDIVDKGVQPELVDANMANKLVEIKKKQENVSDADLKELTYQPLEVDQTADKVVKALSSHNVLAKVLDAEELKVLSDYFSGNRPQDEKVLQVLNTALEKILARAAEFYPDEKELKVFMTNTDQAKVRLLDALLSYKSSFLSNLYLNAFVYANYLRDKMANAYQAAAHTYMVANVVADQSLAAATDAVVFSKEAIEKSAAVASDAVAYSKEAIGKSAAAASDAVVYSKEALERSANAAREMAQKSQLLVATARDDVAQRMATARDLGQGLINTARSWTSISATSTTGSTSDATTPRASPVTSVSDLTKSSDSQDLNPSVVPVLEPVDVLNTALPVITAPDVIKSANTKKTNDKVAKEETKKENKTSEDATGSAKNQQLQPVQEHWLVTLWSVLSMLLYLPYAFFESAPAVSSPMKTDNSEPENLRSSSILLETTNKNEKKK